VIETHTEDSRFVSRLTRDTLALILAGGQGSRLHEMTQWRAKPSVYFGGKFRIIDFPLSNCLNSGVRRIGVLTQYKAHSLVRHLVRGWSGFQSERREFVEILPASQRVGGEWYQGTADAVYQNLDIIRTHNPGLVLVLAGDHVYKMDYGPLLAYHAECQADMTVACLEVPISEAAGQLGVMSVDEQGRVIAFEEKPSAPWATTCSTGIFFTSRSSRTPTRRARTMILARTSSRRSSTDTGSSPIHSVTPRLASALIGVMSEPWMRSGKPTWNWSRSRRN
jgi:glucose-1-phosphate adenylyltransferase